MAGSANSSSANPGFTLQWRHTFRGMSQSGIHMNVCSKYLEDYLWAVALPSCASSSPLPFSSAPPQSELMRREQSGVEHMAHSRGPTWVGLSTQRLIAQSVQREGVINFMDLASMEHRRIKTTTDCPQETKLIGAGDWFIKSLLNDCWKPRHRSGYWSLSLTQKIEAEPLKHESFLIVLSLFLWVHLTYHLEVFQLLGTNSF